jgi:hypothetical protein
MARFKRRKTLTYKYLLQRGWNPVTIATFLRKPYDREQVELAEVMHPFEMIPESILFATPVVSTVTGTVTDMVINVVEDLPILKRATVQPEHLPILSRTP